MIRQDVSKVLSSGSLRLLRETIAISRTDVYKGKFIRSAIREKVSAIKLLQHPVGSFGFPETERSTNDFCFTFHFIQR